jgi:hypothetical protein
MRARYGKNKVIIPGENIHKFILKESSQNISKCPPKLVKQNFLKTLKFHRKNVVSSTSFFILHFFVCKEQ